MTDNGMNFLILDDSSLECGRILMFSSTEQIRKMIGSEYLYMDGTFKTCPKPFNQLYIIHGTYKGENLVLAFIFMSRRNADTYKKIFRTLKLKAMEIDPNGLSPQRIITDFEAAVEAAVNVEFPNSAHFGCWFHFAQALLRNIRETGEWNNFRASPSFKSNYYLKCALAMLPANRISEGAQAIDSVFYCPESFKTYFNNFWLQKAEMVSCFNRITERTNNVSEGYNSSFARNISYSKKNFWALLSKIRREEVAVSISIEKLDMGYAPREKRAEYKTKNRKLEQWKLGYNENNDLMVELQKIKKILKKM